MSKKPFFIAFLLINLVAIFVAKIWINDTWLVTGHDTFQYINWSANFFTEDRSLLFFRPFLYLMMNTAHNLSSWSPYTFEVFLYFCALVSAIILCKILQALNTDYFITLISVIIFLSSRIFYEADVVGYITSLETTLVFACIFFAIKSFKNSSNELYPWLFVLCGLMLTFTHEEKLIFFIPLLFLSFIGNTKVIFKIFMAYITSVAAVFILIGGLNVFNRSFKMAGGIASNWESHWNIFQNFLITFKSSLYGLDPLTQNLLLILSLFMMFRLVNLLTTIFINRPNGGSVSTYYRFFCHSLDTSQLLNCDMTRFLILPALSYLFFTGIIFAGIDLPRITAPISILLVIGFLNIYHKKYSCRKAVYLIVIYVFVLIYFIAPIIQKGWNMRDVNDNSDYAFARSIIPIETNNCSRDTPSILVTNSFDSRLRAPGWGIDEVYGLASKVYYGKCVITESRLKEDYSNNEQKDILEKYISFIVMNEFKENLANNSLLYNLDLSLVHKNVKNCYSIEDASCAMVIYSKANSK